MSEDFWKDLPFFENFDDSFDTQHYFSFHESWHLFVADIQGSTLAIKEGRYKDVNLIGALCIVAVLNACKEIEIPFVFGGDGASILVPNSHFKKAKNALLATKKRALENFNMHLRVGSINVKELYEKDISIKVAKQKVSKDYFQALFQGGGMSDADYLIKNDAKYRYEDININAEADFTGLECRWQDIPSSKDETISLLIYAHESQTYKEVLDYINQHLGRQAQRQPVQESTLNLSFSPFQLYHEANAKHKGLKKYKFLFKMLIINILGLFLMRFNIQTEDTQWGKYKEQVTLTTDSEKFDDMLRMICSISKDERIALEDYLQKAYESQKVCYGIHISNRALMTCLVFERMGSQVHFVDAADGGYAMAAVGLKKQLKTLKLS